MPDSRWAIELLDEDAVTQEALVYLVAAVPPYEAAPRYLFYRIRSRWAQACQVLRQHGVRFLSHRVFTQVYGRAGDGTRAVGQPVCTYYGNQYYVVRHFWKGGAAGWRMSSSTTRTDSKGTPGRLPGGEDGSQDATD